MWLIFQVIYIGIGLVTSYALVNRYLEANDQDYTLKMYIIYIMVTLGWLPIVIYAFFKAFTSSLIKRR